MPFPVPSELLPENTDSRLPELTKEVLVDAARSGWRRIGVAPVIMDTFDRTLELTYQTSSKTDEGMRGAMSETTRIYLKDNGEIYIEQVQETIHRSLSEELGLSDDQIKGLRFVTQDKAAWRLAAFPLGGTEYILGITTVLRLDGPSESWLNKHLERMEPREEIREAHFVDFTKMFGSAQDSAARRTFTHRPGTEKILVAASQLLSDERSQLTPVELPVHRPSISTDTRLRMKDLLKY